MLKNFANVAVATLLLAGCHRGSNSVQPVITVSTNASKHAHTNRLAAEKSPYLLQHQHNPVDWFAWGEEAFAKARAEGKPVLLSIGYSTCHWCHVMERESFEDEVTAKYMNEHFVSIKVDREERPDVDKIYMTFVQAMTGSGGWPLNVFLAPDLKPFYGGTYWPPESKYGRPSFRQILEQVDNAWKNKRAQLTNSSVNLHEQLLQLTSRQPTNAEAYPLDEEVLKKAGAALQEGFDHKHGGWGGAPKFPSPSVPAFLLRHAARTGDREARAQVLHTCERMASGGIYDQLGGGFSRYSVDAQWLVPHFEKMLYDNAQLLSLYLDSYLVSGDQGYADVARDIVRYLLRDMTNGDGGFYSAEDADSEGKDGKFYCWKLSELALLLSADELKVTTRHYGVTEAGNFLDHSDPNPLRNLNVLSVVDTNLTEADRKLLASAMMKMFKVRSQRVRPHLDDKILASWNGLMLGALARAGATLGEDTFIKAAERNVAFLQAKLWDGDTRTLYHRWRDGERDQVQLLEAYAFLLSGVIQLYEATLDAKHLGFAVALADAMLAKFYDQKEGGFWQSAAETKDLILRVKEDYDGAEPSGNSVATLALLRLGAITERNDFREAADKTLRLFADRLHKMPHGVANLLSALDFAVQEPRRVVIAGDVKSAEARALIRAAHGVYQPNRVVLGTGGPVESFARTLLPKDGKATAYVCTGSACQPPTHDPAQVKAALK